MEANRVPGLENTRLSDNLLLCVGCSFSSSDLKHRSLEGSPDIVVYVQRHCLQQLEVCRNERLVYEGQGLLWLHKDLSPETV